MEDVVRLLYEWTQGMTGRRSCSSRPIRRSRCDVQIRINSLHKLDDQAVVWQSVSRQSVSE